jgi:hypothetical protein
MKNGSCRFGKTDMFHENRSYGFGKSKCFHGNFYKSFGIQGTLTGFPTLLGFST